MSDAGEALTRKLGPLPAWGWGVAILGGIGVAVVIRRQAVATASALPDTGAYDPSVPGANGGNTSTPGGAGNLGDWAEPADPAEAPAPLWAGDLADSITDLTDSVEGLYWVVPTEGTGPGQGTGTTARRDTGTPAPRPLPSVRTLRDRYGRENIRGLAQIERQARDTMALVRRGGVSSGEARRYAAATNRARAARAERAERRRERRNRRRGK